jgi:hypothetical protein
MPHEREMWIGDIDRFEAELPVRAFEQVRKVVSKVETTDRSNAFAGRRLERKVAKACSASANMPRRRGNVHVQRRVQRYADNSKENSLAQNVEDERNPKQPHEHGEQYGRSPDLTQAR